MRGLMVAVIGMGVLIVAGVAVLITLLIQRMSPLPPSIATAPTSMVPGTSTNATTTGPALLDEPQGTHIAGVVLAADRLALQLSGGGPDRVVILDGKGRVIGRVELAR